MAAIHIRRVHRLGRATARTRMEEIAHSIQHDLKTDYHWKGDTLHLKRPGASATMHVSDGFVDLKVHLGLLLAPMKGPLEAAIQQRLDEVLG
ncbi:MAG: polyhydroxyalkanoic acid system family protein [Chromatiaceae bacterium]|jgi:putative polyhydroxyalkanoate system protein